MRSDLDPAVVDAAMARYLTPAQVAQLGDLFAMCVMAIAETRAARLAAETDDERQQSARQEAAS